MKYSLLFSLHVTHSFYADQCCEDFEIVPTADTVRLLNKHRCVLKTAPDGLRVLVAVDQNDVPFIALEGEQMFRFQMHLRNPDFAHITQLDGLPATPVFTNANALSGDPIVLSALARRVQIEERFSVQQPDSNAQFVLTGQPAAGLQAQDFSITGLQDVRTPKTYDAVSKRLVVDTSAASTGTVLEVVYEAAPQKSRNVFADVELYYQGTPKNGAVHYEIAFAALQSYWSYYLITDKNGTPYSIKDTNSSPVVFEAATNLKTHPDDADKIAASLAEKYPTKQRYRLLSAAPIPSQQQGRHTLQLLLSNTPVIKQLASPAPHNMVLIKSTGTSEQKIALYQIISHFVQ